ncbi:MAG: hypothetical protein QNJ64_19185 [Crocosphaera sp.]|nr:hypothetical protein [Crocosphaera sp.]
MDISALTAKIGVANKPLKAVWGKEKAAPFSQKRSYQPASFLVVGVFE